MGEPGGETEGTLQRIPRMVRFASDLARAARTLRRAPAFTVASAAIAAAGIGAVTAIFSLVDPILLRPLPYAAPGKLVMVWERDADGADSRIGYATFKDLQDESRTLASAAAMGSWQPTIAGGDGAPERLTGQRVTWRFFALLGVEPALGRSFVAAEDAPGQPRGIILTDGLWRRRFGGDPAIVGRAVTLDGDAMEVLGVLPAGFDDVFEPGAEIFRVLGYGVAQPWACRTCRHLRMVARIAGTATRRSASAELNGLSQRIVAAHPSEYPAAGVDLVPVQAEVTREARPALVAMLSAALFLLLVSAANVISLGLARAARRGPEFAVRRALGSGRAHLARQLVAEGVLLAVAGGVGGLALAAAALRLLVAHLPADLPRLAAVRLDPEALALAAIVTLGLGLSAGLAPLATAAGRRPLAATRSAAGVAGARSQRGRAAIVVAEVAVTLMLLVGCGLLARSLLTLLAVDPGFDPGHLLTLEIQSTGGRYADDTAVWDYHDRVRAAAAAVPGVVAAEVASQLPLGGNFDGFGVQAQDRPLPNPELAPGAQRYAVSAGYLSALRIPLLAGRAFVAADGEASAPPVAIVSNSLAHRLWGGESAVGKRIEVGDAGWRTVVGVCGDVRHTGLESSDLSGFYLPERQWRQADSEAVLVVRTATDPAALASSVVHAVRAVDPAQPIQRVRTGGELIATTTARRRLALTLFVAFALVATLLSAAGVYGALAGAVAERRRDIGIRAALGATPLEIVNLVLRQGLALAGIGLALGLGGALALARYLRALLFGIEPTDPPTLAAGVLLLAGVALAACLLPAWRAMRVDPVTALRAD